MSGGTELVTAAAPSLQRFERAIAAVADRAEELDRSPRFPLESIALLREAGALALTVPREGGRVPIAEEWALVRALGGADGSVARIVDGHLNAVERIAVTAPAALAEAELERVGAGQSLLGVWGADPAPEEGEPARLLGGERIEGVKTFCSGAGGLDGALVLVRDPGAPGPPLLAWVDLDESVEVDRDWYAGSGLRASESHRVVFHSTPVRAVLGGPGEIAAEPWFSRDALRTAASWAGMADAAAEDALADLAARRRGEELAHLAAGRIAAARATIDSLLATAAAAAEAGEPLRALSVRLRAELAGAAGRILEEAARACGSRPFATGSRLDRARRDLELFTLQHRLDPLLAADGRRLLEPEAGA